MKKRVRQKLPKNKNELLAIDRLILPSCVLVLNLATIIGKDFSIAEKKKYA